jgi:hypothetical protein
MLVVVSAKGGPLIEITDGRTFWDDKPHWAPDGRLIYFASDRGGLSNVWAIGFDLVKGAPVGDAFPLTTFKGLGQAASGCSRTSTGDSTPRPTFMASSASFRHA